MLAMVVFFCSPDGRPFEVIDERKHLTQFAVTNKLIDGASHYSNLEDLSGYRPFDGGWLRKEVAPAAALGLADGDSLVGLRAEQLTR